MGISCANRVTILVACWAGILAIPAAAQVERLHAQRKAPTVPVLSSSILSPLAGVIIVVL